MENNIFTAIINTMQDIGIVGKGDENKYDNYEDDVRIRIDYRG